jgi:hypothetical protein
LSSPADDAATRRPQTAVTAVKSSARRFTTSPPD